MKPTLLFAFIIWCWCPANAQIINKGAFKVEAGTDVFFQNEYTNATSGNHVSNGNLYLNNNFVNNGTTQADAGTTYFKSNINKMMTLTGTRKQVNFYNLEVEMTCAGYKGLLVSEDFTVSVANAVNLESGDLRLTGNAQLIQTHAGVSLNQPGSGKLLRDQIGHGSTYQYDYWASPVNNGGTFALAGGMFDGADASKNPFTPQQILFNSGKPYNGLPTVMDGSGNVLTPMTINTRWFYKYSRGSGAYSEWIRINQSHKLVPGEGYIIKGSGAAEPTENYVFYGTPNSGDYSFEITNKERILKGNPYPSELNAKKFLEDNIGIIEQLEFWVDGGSPSHVLSDYLGGYATFNHVGGATASVPSERIHGVGNASHVAAPTKHMPVAKGFFVDAIGTGKITFKNSQRIFKAEPLPNSARRNEFDADINNQYIRLGYEGPEGFHRQLLLGFLPGSPADMGFNSGYDAIQSGTRRDDMFFIIENDLSKRYTIQGDNAYSEEMEFPIGLLVSELGIHKVMIDEVENFSGSIYLRDNLLATSHDLTEAMFQISLPEGEYLDRFSIVFKPVSTLNTNDLALNKTLVYYNGNEQIVVSNPDQLPLNTITIYNVLGQYLMSVSKNLNDQKIVIPFKEAQGVYMVVLNTNTSKKSIKIIKY